MTKYVFDSSSFIVLSHYFPARFPSFWDAFNQLVVAGNLISVREVMREIEVRAAKPHLRNWIIENRRVFLPPTPKETLFVRKILSNQHFQQLISAKQRLKSGPAADPFVVACAQLTDACVVTEEQHKPNAARIPNVCAHYDIDCTSLEGMMERERWVF